MRIAIVHPAMMTDRLAEAFARAVDIGVDGVEVHYASAAIAAVLNDPGHAAQLKEAAFASGLAVAGLCLDCFCAEPALIGRPEIVDRSQHVLLGAMGTAGEAGAAVVAVPFFGKNTIEADGEFDRAAAALLEMIEHAEETGVVLAIESTLAIHQQENLLNLLGYPPEAGIYYNTAVAVSRKQDPATAIRQLGSDAIAQVRIRDVRVVEGAPPDFGVPIGSGDIDFDAVGMALAAVGFDGWVVVEPPPVDDEAGALAVAAEAVRFTRAALKDVVGQ
jgi:sugar phosphate isomerase/epimerase